MTLPELGVSRIFKQRRKVDLPLPLAPIMVTTSPFETVKSISCNTSKLPKDFSNVLLQ